MSFIFLEKYSNQLNYYFKVNFVYLFLNFPKNQRIDMGLFVSKILKVVCTLGMLKYFDNKIV